ncbi:MAG: PEP-CTERM sorting domain-containing protein [Planctomycetota bacterium]
MRSSLLAAGAFCTLAALPAAPARADLVVNEDLGTLALNSITSRTGTTVGGANNAAAYTGLVDTFFWGEEFVYQFTLADTGVLSIDSTDDDGAVSGIDNDFILLNSLTTGPNDSGTGPDPEAIGDIGFSTGGADTFGVLDAGTYFLSVDAFGFDALSTSPGAYAFELIFDAFVPPAPPPAIDALLGGSLTNTLDAAEVLFYEFVYDGLATTIDTFGTAFDTELGLFDADGILITSNDDAAFGVLQSELDISGLTAGETYYLAAGGWDLEFADGFSVTAFDEGEFGTLQINGLSPAAIPEPGTVGLVGIAAFGGLFARRRRGRQAVAEAV